MSRESHSIEQRDAEREATRPFRFMQARRRIAERFRRVMDEFVEEDYLMREGPSLQLLDAPD